MPENGDLYENKLERVYADIKRLDQLRDADADAAKALDNAAKELAAERDRRLDQRMDGQETAVQAALAAAEKAVSAALVASEKGVNKAEMAQQKVNETQNEFRGQLKDQATLFMPRTEAESLIRELRGLISGVSATQQELRSRIDVGPPSLGVLQARSDQQQGRSSGALDTRALFFAVLGVLGVLGGIVIALTR